MSNRFISNFTAHYLWKKVTVPLVCGGIICTGALTGGLVSGVKDTEWCLDAYHLSTSKYWNILEPMAGVSAIFIGNFVVGCVQGALITTTLPVLGPMYLYKKYQENRTNIK